MIIRTLEQIIIECNDDEFNHAVSQVVAQGYQLVKSGPKPISPTEHDPVVRTIIASRTRLHVDVSDIKA